MMRQICHEHCPKGGGGLLALLAGVVAVALAAAARSAVHVLGVLLHWLAAAVLAVCAAAMLGFAVWGALAERHRRARVPAQAVSRAAVPESVQVVSARQEEHSDRA
jgi:hypothetical protein